MSDQQIKFAVIGMGYIGKRHAELIQKNPECQLIAVCDIADPATLQLGTINAPFYSDIQQLLDQHPDIAVVSICTPNGIHTKQSLKALDHDKHVIIEKPMGLTKAECEEVIFKSLNKSKHVFCVMQNRYSPPSAWLKEMVSTNKLGDIHMVQVNCYWNRDDRYYFKNGKKHSWKGTKELDGGVLYTQFAHFIDILYWLFGDIDKLQCKFHNFAHTKSTAFEDSGMVAFNFKNGGMGAINFSTAVWDKNMESSITILGSKGSVKVGGQYMNEVEYCHVEGYEMPELAPTNPANDYGKYKGSAANHVYVFENVVDVLKNRKSITTNALEGLKVVEIIERIYSTKN